jgi:hypothetical protein
MSYLYFSYADVFYTAFTDKVERSCHFPAPGRNCYNTGKLILLFYVEILRTGKML